MILRVSYVDIPMDQMGYRVDTYSSAEIPKSIFDNKWTKMTTFIKTKFKKSDDQTNIDKYI